MYGYIYETTNLINGKKYIGKHKSNRFDKNYYGSGVSFKQDLNKYGKENFKTIILEEIDTNQEDLDKAEIRWIEAANAVRSNKYYNNSYGGKNEGWYPYHKAIKDNPKLNPWLNRNHTEETKKKISESRKGKPAWNKGLTKEIDERVKAYTDKMTNSKLGSIPWNKGLTKETDNRLHGYIHSNETKRKISETLKGHIVLDETKRKISKSSGNRKWINNGIKNKRVKLEELDLYIKCGYKLGRI